MNRIKLFWNNMKSCNAYWLTIILFRTGKNKWGANGKISKNHAKWRPIRMKFELENCPLCNLSMIKKLLQHFNYFKRNIAFLFQSFFYLNKSEYIWKCMLRCQLLPWAKFFSDIHYLFNDDFCMDLDKSLTIDT